MFDCIAAAGKFEVCLHFVNAGFLIDQSNKMHKQELLFFAFWKIL